MNQTKASPITFPEAFPKIEAKVAKDILARYEPDENLTEHLLDHPEQKKQLTKNFLMHLVARKFFLDAFKFLAHALPKREAVWWACIAAKQDETLSNDKPRQQTLKAALTTAENWVKQPNEATRRKAESLAKLTEYKSASSWAAQAAFWAGNSITPENEPPVSPPEYLYAHAVFGALALAAADACPKKTQSKAEHILQQGLDIAAGGRGEPARQPVLSTLEAAHESK